ncbi:MAG: M15 family metallopeptidase [Spirochaetaceae bacterium]
MKSTSPNKRHGRRRALPHVLALGLAVGLAAVPLLPTAGRGDASAAETRRPLEADGSIDPVRTPIRATPLPEPTVEAGAAEVGAIAAAYPERIEETSFREGEWALRIDGRWYYWEGGRLLTGDLRPRSQEFTPLRFYRYYTGPLQIREIEPETAERLRRILSERASNPPVRHPGFQDALYGISSRAEAESTMVELTLLGHRTRVHPVAVDALRRVETDVRQAASRDPEVAEFVRGLAAVEGFHWRNIAGTRARSYHSYGVAVDLIPRYYGGDFGYWRWAAEAGIEDWWALGENDRFMIPQPIIDSFEENGFVWGGKWLFFDPIHFEYRPEVFLLE